MPYPSEHNIVLLDPSTPHVRVRRSKNGTVQGKELIDTISVIWFIDEDNKPKAQSLRFPIKNWKEAEARDWLKKNKIKYQEFEPAIPEENNLCYTAVNQSDDELNISLHGDIGFEDDTTSKVFYDMLTPNLKTINIDMNTRGGSVMDGLSIYNQLKDHPAKVNIKISGSAASMGSVIAMAADYLEMPKTAVMMMHKPLLPVLIAANADKMRKTAEALDVMESSIIAAYKTRLDKTELEISKMLTDETWLNGEQAMDLGLVDETNNDPVNRDLIYHDFSVYKNVPEMAIAMSIDANDEVDIPEEDILKPGILARIKKYIFEDIEIDKPITEENSMDQVAIDKLVAENTASQNTITILTTENETLKAAVSTFETEKLTQATDARKAENKTFLDDMVKEGRIRPVDVDNHLDTLELKFQGENGETKVNDYKAWLKTLPVVVDLTGHIADKTVASTKSDDPLELLTQKIMAEDKMDYASALRVAYSQHPEYLKQD